MLTIHAGERTGIGEGDQPPQVGIVASMGQVAFRSREELEQAALGVVEDRAHRHAFTP